MTLTGSKLLNQDNIVFHIQLAALDVLLVEADDV